MCMESGAQKLTPAERRAREAVDAVHDDNVWRAGKYTGARAGSSTRITAAKVFCDMHDVGPGDDFVEYLDRQTGALVIFPSEVVDGDE